MPNPKREPRLSKQDALERFAGSLPRTLERQTSARDPDIVRWAASHFLIEPDTPITLLPHQIGLLRLFAWRDEHGPRFRTRIYSTVKKSGKTTMAALMTRHDAESGPPGREIYLAANDRDQATNRVFQAIRHSIELDPAARRYWKITEHELRHANGTFIRAIAQDFRGEAGANPGLTVWTELWGFEHEAAVRFYEELTPVPTVPSVRLVETSAGYEGQSGLLWELHALGVEGHQLTAHEFATISDTTLGAFSEASRPEHLVPVWINRDAGTVMYWDTGLAARRMPWQRGTGGERYYAEQERTLRPGQFRRLHLNEWSQSEEAFLPIEWWDACQEELPELGPNESLVLGIDGGVSNDPFALVGVSRHPEPSRHHEIAVRLWGIWHPPRDGKIDFEEIFQEILRLKSRYHLKQVAYDPFQLEYFAQRLRRAGIWAFPIDQGRPREKADKLLYDRIRDGSLVHCRPAEIREHLLNANAKMSDGRMRVVKRTDRLKVDLVVAMSMAAEECGRLNL